MAEFLVGGSVALLQFLVAVAFIVLIFRNNVLAYVGAAFCLPIAEPLISLLSQPAAFLRWNGFLLGVLAATVLACTLVARKEIQSPL